MGGSARVDRVTPDDAISLATDVGPVPMQVGAVLRLGASVTRDAVAARVEARLPAVPRLAQRLVSTPFGAGRAVWVDDERFDVDRHVTARECPMPADEDAVLALATAAVTDRLPPDRPLWRMLLVTGLPDGECALVVVFHHVLADGIGGLAVLAELVDGMGAAPPALVRHPAPTRRELYRDATCERLCALRDVRGFLPQLRDAVIQLRPRRGAARFVATSLNRPTGAERHVAVVRVPLAPVVAAGHAHAATVNDVVLAAVGAATGRLVAARGEELPELIVSVPVSVRGSTEGRDLGNAVGVMPVAVPTTGERRDRIERVTDATRAGKAVPRTTSSVILGPVFRLLARLGLFRWFIERQHLVHTFVTNLRGPDVELRLLDVPITDVAAITVVTGNVTASFAVLSYAGTLAVSVITDPVACPDHRRLAALLEEDLLASG
jgi:WS/DGAT/MGAT family acyltransferase